MDRDRRLDAPGPPARSDAHEPIAVVGIGCRYPGGIVDAASFWRVVVEGIDTITEIPRDRFDPDVWYDSRPGTPGRIGSRHGGFVGPLDAFDAFLFGISPREAERLDPQQRLLLEVAWEAFHDAGLDPTRQDGLSCGVYIGQWVGEYEGRLFADPAAIDFHATQGTGRYASSGRLSYTFGLQGPSLTLDTACSSSLVATHLAVQSLRSGETSMSLVGGVNLILEPHTTIAYSRGRMMAADGHSKFGDASADGYVRAEGAAVVLLKRQADAVRDGDRIYALIEGSAINNDGRSSGLFGRPSRLGQATLLAAAYRDAGVDPVSLQFVEAHGTGTRAGDPVELDAIAEVAGGRTGPLWVGSIKTNIGHTEAAAGLAGLIKASLSLYHGVVPPSLHFREPTTAVDWAAMPLRIPTAPVALAGDRSAWRGGVTSFGISGTNAHVVLAAAAPPLPAVPRAGALVLPLAAHLPAALAQLAGAVAARIDGADHDEVARIAATLSRRAALAHRAVVVGADPASVAAGLRALAAGEPAPGLVVGQAPAERRYRVALVFPGQGAQWEGMGRRLLATEPAFAAAVRDVDAALTPLASWSLAEQLVLDPTDPGYQLDRIDVIQPVLVGLEIAYACLLRAYGIEADAVVGHSMGEVAAAWYAGALSLEDAMAVVVHRSRLLRTVAGGGAMAVVELPEADAQAAIGARTDRVSVAVVNASNASVLSGDPAAIDEILGELGARGVFTRPVKVDVASHSAQMDPLVDPLVQAISAIAPASPRTAFYSTVDAAAVTGPDLTPAYWGRNLRRPVRFAETVNQMLDDGYDLFIELGPHPILANAIGRAIEDREADARVLVTGRREEDGQVGLLSLLGEVFVAGVPVDWRRVYPDPVDRELRVPPLPMIRERHWFDRPDRSGAPGVRLVAGRLAHPFLGALFRSAAAGTCAWEWSAAPTRPAWLADHVVRRSVLWPAAASAEGLRATAAEASAETAWSLRNVRFHEALSLEPDRPVHLQWSHGGDPMGGRVQLHARETTDGATWRLIADAVAVPARADKDSSPDWLVEAEQAETGTEIYDRLRSCGLEYGPAFQAMTAVTTGRDAARSTAAIPAPVANDPGLDQYGVHPVVLDAALQTLILAGLGADDTTRATPLPVAIGQLDVVPGPGALDEVTIRARITARDGRGFSGDVVVADANGRTVLTAEAVAFAWTAADRKGIDDALLTLRWEPVALRRMAQSTGQMILLGRSADTAPLLEALRSAGVDATAAASIAVLSPPAGSGSPAALTWCVPGMPGDGAAAWSEQLVNDAIGVATWCAEQGGRVARLTMITRGAALVAGNAVTDPAAAGARAVGSVAGHEQPSLRVALIDLDSSAPSAVAVDALLADAGEAELGWRDGQWYAARLDRWAEPDAGATGPAPSYALELTTPGSPEHLRWSGFHRVAPEADQVEVEVDAVGLNFMNVLSMLGALPGAPGGVGSLGLEGAGRVVRIGRDVRHVAVGDRVVFVAPEAMARHVTTAGALVVRCPSSITADVAAGLPIAYLTVHYGLGVQARLGAGERVLIHSAAGGVGLAAIAYARHAGAEILATAGTPEKRAWLRSLGIAHVFDSRDLRWADDVLAATDGEGVDVVLNSLAGEAQERGVAVLRPYGRFVEIGKRDIYADRPLGLGAFRRNLAFFAVDLDRMLRERPDRVGAMLGEVMALVERGVLAPLPTATYPADAVHDAYRAMLPGVHRGKLVVSFETSPRTIAPAEPTAPIRGDGSYLVTGGLGGLGLTVAAWLVERGAGRIVLAGRRPPDEAASARIAALAAGGALIETRSVDVSDRARVAALLGETAHAAPWRGVFHLAGALDDGPITALTPARVAVPFRPKAWGGWHLHELARTLDLDFVVAFSSIASRFGTPGQASYAAANAVLDALAGPRMLSINFGPFGSVGLAAADATRLRSLARQGFAPLEPADAVAALDRLLGTGARGAVTCARFDAAAWADGKDAPDRAWASRLLTEAPAAATVAESWRDRVAAVPVGRARRQELERLLIAEAAATLRLPPSHISADRPLRTLGMDSLLTLEFRKRLERSGGLQVGATVFFSHPTIAALAPLVAERWSLELEPAASGQPSGEVDLDALMGELAGLGDDELQALLGDGEGS
ncbi:MAG: acyltransferase domain-containing protein [Gemmatimonadales bacterium]|nr:acyltransferase domain-containing protein [Gemmatimonadales bacterium]